ncbi:N,N-dimethylformamidase beta subunit family domain-containing protein [Streptosporangium sp. 'caverna']|uniref:N,N-dimethylformamidase beta subunit family domain-containing protein n=1 Tax=Streptosporangium sp. 'caverna' TaxID=2202249 RepID=UPI0019551334|nr:N,N-dimethylformamidase beta subunit family domain-containing protein [Streptosporangium sp. 'caverna']
MRRMSACLAALAVTSLVAGCTVLPRAGGLPSPPATPAAVPSTTRDTARAAPAASSTSVENARKGSPHWRTRRPGAEHEIEGFADRVSMLPGESFRLYVSTTAARYTVRAFRVGWYGGAGARKVWESEPLPGRRQAPPETIAATRTVTAARWKPGPAVDTSGWPEGSYLLRLDADTGAGRYVPVTVRSASTRGRLVVVNAVTTWQAYNDWGGRSLYRGPGGFEDRSRAVSFDRPYDTSGARLFLDMERDAIEVAERSGVPLAYVTNRELDDDPHILDGATGLISLGHDEYWSAHMRRTVEAARDRGTNLAFLGANAVYWRIRFARTPLGAGRLVVCGKDDAGDPGTRLWREDEPESSLTGPMYDCFPAEAAYVVYNPGHWIFKGTGVRRGTAFPGMAGVETDKVFSGVPRPMEILSISPLNCGGRSTIAHSAYYTVPGGAAVFSSGTMRWVCALRGARCGHGVTGRAAAFVRRATTNILRTFAAGPAGRLHPAEDNLEPLGLGGPWDG